jgi:hypothetical protein
MAARADQPATGTRRRGRPKLPSRLSGRARAALVRTAAARSAIDTLIADVYLDDAEIGGAR